MCMKEAVPTPAGLRRFSRLLTRCDIQVLTQLEISVVAKSPDVSG